MLIVPALILFYTIIFIYLSIWIENSIAVRIRGPASANGTGRVQIFHNGQWASICDDNWGINNARVVCLQLGYKYGVRAIRGGQVLPGSGNLWLHDVNCTGYEQCLSSCSHKGWANQRCTHFNDAGVECSYTGKTISIGVYYRQLSQNYFTFAF